MAKKTFRIAVTETTTIYYDVQASSLAGAEKICKDLNSGKISDIEEEIGGEFAGESDYTEQTDWRVC